MEMNELKVSQQAGVITTNLDAIEAEIKKAMADYKDYVVTEDTIKADKKILSDLRKKRTELDDARKAVKKAWNEPYEKFEKRCKEVIALVDEPIKLIDTQLKMFDEERANAKKVHIKELYDANIEGYERFLPFDKIMTANPKWCNVSTTDQDILFDLSAMVLKVKNDLSAIKALNSEIEEEVIDAYEKSANDLSVAIQRNSQYLADKNKIVEQVKEAEIAKPTKQLNDLAKQIKMVHFVVSEADAEQVREMLSFANITFREE